MEYIGLASQVIIALGIFNVWLFRFGRHSQYRGGDAVNMREEFATYGLPGWSLYLVGFLKILVATLLLVGIYYSVLVIPSATIMVLLMSGAVVMHLKVKDSFKKSGPALSLLVLSVLSIIF